MIQNTYFKIACALIILFMVCCFIEKKVNKYSYEKGTAINKVKIPDIIQESIPIVRNLDVVSDLFTSLFSFIFIVIFLINGKYRYIILYTFVFLLMRLVTFIYFVSTTLPDSSKKCKYGSDFFKTSMNMGSCNNLGISGHFINIVFQLGLIYRYYGPKYTIDCITSTFVGLFFIYEIDNIQKGLNFVLGKKYFNL